MGTYILPMCGRFTHRYTWADIHRLYRLTSPASNVQPSYNVCPTDTVNVVTSVQDTRILQPMRWGLIPRWWTKPLKDLMRLSTFNARVETVTTKPFFREAFHRTRCIIPASGYYEWQGVLLFVVISCWVSSARMRWPSTTCIRKFNKFRGAIAIPDCAHANPALPRWPQIRSGDDPGHGHRI
jgi:SOS response associated peptidase (SRAP)